MSVITLTNYSPRAENTQLTAKLIECYRSVFADAPWNEWVICRVCNAYWGRKDAPALASAGFMHCDAPLEDYWPRHTVAADVAAEITAEAFCTLALCNEDVVGFSWGYPIKVADLEKKIGISIRERLPRGLRDDDLVGYQDEIGVVPAYRGRKIAKVMNAARVRNLHSRGLPILVSRVRRSPEPSVTYLWYTEKLGYRVIAEYEDGRVVLARESAGLPELL